MTKKWFYLLKSNKSKAIKDNTTIAFTLLGFLFIYLFLCHSSWNKDRNIEYQMEKIIHHTFWCLQCFLYDHKNFVFTDEHFFSIIILNQTKKFSTC